MSRRLVVAGGPTVPHRHSSAPAPIASLSLPRAHPSFPGGGDAMEARKSPMRWTYAEYARLPMSGSTRYEVIDGELAVTPSPSLRHQQVVINLAAILHNFVRANALGRVFPAPLDVLFGEGDYLQPDLLFVRADRAHLLSERGVEAAPDLVVEILSPSTAQRDRGIKLERYRHFGVREY